MELFLKDSRNAVEYQKNKEQTYQISFNHGNIYRSWLSSKTTSTDFDEYFPDQNHAVICSYFSRILQPSSFNLKKVSPLYRKLYDFAFLLVTQLVCISHGTRLEKNHHDIHEKSYVSTSLYKTGSQGNEHVDESSLINFSIFYADDGADVFVHILLM